MSTTPESAHSHPAPLTTGAGPRSTATPRRLTRVQQLTLTTWRWAEAKLQREVAPSALLEQSAVHIVLAVLRDTRDPLALFERHAHAADVFSLVASIVLPTGRPPLDHEIVDTAFLLRWRELTADGTGPEELPPLGPRPRPQV